MTAKKSNTTSPGVKGAQSGKPTGQNPPFSKGGKPTVNDGADGAATPQPGARVDHGDSSWDVDATQTPTGGRVLKADPSPQAVNRGAVGNPGAPGAQSPFKNLR
jgi:hypothetical protein